MKIVAFGEVMMRLHTNNNLQGDTLKTFIGGAEYNVIANLASFGHDTYISTTVPNNELGSKVINHAHLYGINSSKIECYGDKIGMYFTLAGNEYVPMKVLYDRKNSSFYNYDQVVAEDVLSNCDLVHISGVTAALNPYMRAKVLEIVKLAREKEIKVSYDSNYRAKLWSQDEAGDFLKEILNYCDYAFLGILDIKYLLKYDVDDLAKGYSMVKRNYSNIIYICSTTREIINQSQHKMTGHIYSDALYTSKTYTANIIERVGTGDSYTAGCLHAIISNLDENKIAEYGICNNVLKHYYEGDNYVANIDNVIRLMEDKGGKIER